MYALVRVSRFVGGCASNSFGRSSKLVLLNFFVILQCICYFCLLKISRIENNLMPNCTLIFLTFVWTSKLHSFLSLSRLSCLTKHVSSSSNSFALSLLPLSCHTKPLASWRAEWIGVWYQIIVHFTKEKKIRDFKNILVILGVREYL